jgi:hypothetical protein
MKHLYKIFGICLLFACFTVFAKGESSIVGESKILNGKRLSVRFHIRNLPPNTQRQPVNHTIPHYTGTPISHNNSYVDRLEVSYGGKKVFVHSDALVTLFEVEKIHSFRIDAEKKLVFEVDGGDRYEYNYRYYIDPQTYRLDRIESWPLDGSPPAGFVMQYQYK